MKDETERKNINDKSSISNNLISIWSGYCSDAVIKTNTFINDNGYHFILFINILFLYFLFYKTEK